ncbi:MULTISPECIES: hypothetical protein [Clostridium]|uniref:hypothetical protein n=1 Tax=Clostridium TaxID=1485 RepID=UPI00189902BB|nr:MULTISPECIES: hypothetical protein [Clostridium]MDI9215859.1 hypothetical protein [Clostridium tertium]
MKAIKFKTFILIFILIFIGKYESVDAKIDVSPSSATTGNDPIKIYVDTDGEPCNIKYSITRDFPFISSMFSAPGNNTQTFASDGIWYLHVYNKTTKETLTTGPYIRETSPPNKPTIDSPNGWIKGSTKITINSNGDNGSIGYDAANNLWSPYTSGVSKIQWGYDNTPWYDYKNSIYVEEEGWKVIEARVLDNVGNISEVVRKSFGIDNSSPIFNGNDINNSYGWSKDDVLINQSALDNLSGMKTIELYDSFNKKLLTEKSIINYKVSNSGISKYKLKAIDNVGNFSEKNIVVKIDKNSPEIYSDSNDKWSKDYMEIKISAKDTESGMNKIELYDEKGKKIDYGLDSLWFYVEDEGIKNYTVKAYDNVGNVSTKDMTVKIDKTPPTGKVTYDYNENTFVLDMSVSNIIEKGSGVDRIWAEFYPEYEEERKITQDLINTNNVYKGKRNLFELFPDSIEPIEVVIKAIDKVGNEGELFRQVFDQLKIEATITRDWKPNQSIFQEGELGVVHVKLFGGIDFVEIEFPEELNKLAEESEEYSSLDTDKYLTPKKNDSFDYKFYVPIGAEHKIYTVKVTGHKNDKKKIVYPKMEVRGNILNEVRTRIR